MKPTAIDLYAAEAGASDGLAQAGCDVRLAIESDRDSVATYRANFPRVAIVAQVIEAYSPARVLREARLKHGMLDVIAACPPCQGFSTLGKCDPGDTRNDHVATVGALTIALKPRVLILENVPGLAQDPAVPRALEAASGRWLRRWLMDCKRDGVLRASNRRRLIVMAVHGLSDEEISDPRESTTVPGGVNTRTLQEMSLAPWVRQQPTIRFIWLASFLLR